VIAIWLIVTCGCAALFTGIGVYAYKAKKPMHFWSGSTVLPEEIENIKAYNRANGHMWTVYSMLFWAAAVLGIWFPEAGAILLAVSSTVGILPLIVIYKHIYKKYRRKQEDIHGREA